MIEPQKLPRVIALDSWHRGERTEKQVDLEWLCKQQADIGGKYVTIDYEGGHDEANSCISGVEGSQLFLKCWDDLAYELACIGMRETYWSGAGDGRSYGGKVIINCQTQEYIQAEEWWEELVTDYSYAIYEVEGWESDPAEIR